MKKRAVISVYGYRSIIQVMHHCAVMNANFFGDFTFHLFVAATRLNLALPDTVGIPSPPLADRGPHQLRSLLRQPCFAF
jgi:hypothetical protein